MNYFDFQFLPIFPVLLGLASGYVVLYYPQLGLPDSQTFQLLCRNHPFEAYDIKYAYKFAFEKSYVVSIRARSAALPLFEVDKNVS